MEAFICWECVGGDMREFENDDFPYHLAEGIESIQLTVPDDEARTALAYVRQFVYRTSGRSELLHGYIPESYIDALVRVRDASSNRGFNSAVEQLGVAGASSREVTEYDDDSFALLEVEASFESESSLSSIARDNRADLSDGGRDALYSIREIIQNVSHQESVMYYVPVSVFDEVAPLLDAEGVLL